MRVFVAGATGVIGRRTVARLVAANHEVTGVARSEAKAALLRSLGATPVRVELFDADAVTAAVVGHDAVVNLATHVPAPRDAARPGAWNEHNRIRSEGSRILVDAALATGAQVYIQESLAFVYVDGGGRWLDEDTPLLSGRLVEPVKVAEGHVQRFTDAGGRGVVLRFGEFHSEDSSLTLTVISAARRGISGRIGTRDGFAPVIHADDAAAAVVHALEAPAGVYNVVDDEPLTGAEYDAALAAALGVRTLRRPLGPVLRVAGSTFEYARTSNRASNQRFKSATGWKPAYPSARETLNSIVTDRRGVVSSLVTNLIAVAAVTSAAIGLYAQFFPRGFYDDFPLGRAWVAADGPFNEHLVRDFGAMNLALAFVLGVAVFVGTRVLAIAGGGAYLVFGLPHLVYHLRHLDAYSGGDKIANVVLLGGGVVLGVAVLALALVQGRTGTSSSTSRSP